MVAQNQEQIFVVTSDAQVTFLLERVLKSMGYTFRGGQDRASVLKDMETYMPSLVILGERLNDGSGLDLAKDLGRRYPNLPMVLIVNQDAPETLKTAMRLGVTEYLTLPLRSDDILRAIKNSLELANIRRQATLLEARRATSSLQRRLDELEALTRLGRTVTSSLDLDSTLTSIVDAAVQLTGAEEGSLLLLDEETGELYMRAARNFQEEFVHTFRLPVKDTLAGSVIRNGQSVLVDDNTPQKIKTAYLVQSLLYVPLTIKDRVIGVLGIDNRQNRLPFSNHHVKLLEALAEFAVIALENARLYSATISEQEKLTTILTDVKDGVIVVDQNEHLLLVNQVVREALALGDADLKEKSFREIFAQPALIELLETQGKSMSNRSELELENGQVFNLQISTIAGVGLAFTLTDITNLKKIDRIKSDFVHTVSHDLRSPLTAILGYVELIERAGQVNDLQRDFIRRVQVSVHNITSLVDDLLDLGRIESGFDTRKETLHIDQILQYSIDGMKKRIAERGLMMQVSLSPQFPTILGNPVQIRELVDHLLDNAIKYTPHGGSITIKGDTEGSQIILQFNDNGIGIPALDIPYIFDKFYRATNASTELTGTGLGLSIVKSIVENHQGRVWVDSSPGKGSTFTVVLPLTQK